MGDNSTPSAWLRTTVTYQTMKPNGFNRNTGDIAYAVQSSQEQFESLPVKEASQPLDLAVQEHLRQLRSSVKSDAVVAKVHVDICSLTQQLRTKIVKQGREVEAVDLPPVWLTQCRELQTTEQLPEAEALAKLFRGAEMAVAVLGPVEKPAAEVVVKSDEYRKEGFAFPSQMTGPALLGPVEKPEEKKAESAVKMTGQYRGTSESSRMTGPSEF